VIYRAAVAEAIGIGALGDSLAYCGSAPKQPTLEAPVVCDPLSGPECFQRQAIVYARNSAAIQNASIAWNLCLCQYAERTNGESYNCAQKFQFVVPEVPVADAGGYITAEGPRQVAGPVGTYTLIGSPYQPASASTAATTTTAPAATVAPASAPAPTGGGGSTGYAVPSPASGAPAPVASTTPAGAPAPTGGGGGVSVTPGQAPYTVTTQAPAPAPAAAGFSIGGASIPTWALVAAGAAALFLLGGRR
jgi:hypothetical protein